jgi:hypothetical protein
MLHIDLIALMVSPRAPSPGGSVYGVYSLLSAAVLEKEKRARATVEKRGNEEHHELLPIVGTMTLAVRRAAMHIAGQPFLASAKRKQKLKEEEKERKKD